LFFISTTADSKCCRS